MTAKVSTFITRRTLLEGVSVFALCWLSAVSLTSLLGGNYEIAATLFLQIALPEMADKSFFLCALLAATFPRKRLQIFFGSMLGLWLNVVLTAKLGQSIALYSVGFEDMTFKIKMLASFFLLSASFHLFGWEKLSIYHWTEVGAEAIGLAKRWEGFKSWINGLGMAALSAGILMFFIEFGDISQMAIFTVSASDIGDSNAAILFGACAAFVPPTYLACRWGKEARSYLDHCGESENKALNYVPAVIFLVYALVIFAEAHGGY